MTSEQSIELAKERHVQAINNAIDALINIEDYTPLPSELKSALSKLNSMRFYAEEPVESGSRVYDTFTNKVRTIARDGAINWFFEDEDTEHGCIGKKYCFPIAI